MKSRRGLLAAGAALPALAWTGAARAQAKPPVVIGWLETGSRERSWANKAFHEGMAALGWNLGAQYVLEERYADGRVERLPELAQEIAARRPAVIVAGTSRPARAATAAAPTTPVVLCNGDPLSTGLVTNLARPGGMITGVSNASAETRLKVIELLVETMPTLRRVGFLVDSSGRDGGSGAVTAHRKAAEHFRLEAVIVEMAKPEDIEPAMAQLAKAEPQALVIVPSTWFDTHIPVIIASALARRLPAVGIQASIPREGGLFSFGHNAPAAARRSAYYVDRILKGTKPGDLPIEQPALFDLVLNLKTAQQLGIVIPRSMMIRATQVIE